MRICFTSEGTWTLRVTVSGFAEASDVTWTITRELLGRAIPAASLYRWCELPPSSDGAIGIHRPKGLLDPRKRSFGRERAPDLAQDPEDVKSDEHHQADQQRGRAGEWSRAQLNGGREASSHKRSMSTSKQPKIAPRAQRDTKSTVRPSEIRSDQPQRTSPQSAARPQPPAPKLGSHSEPQSTAAADPCSRPPARDVRSLALSATPMNAVASCGYIGPASCRPGSPTTSAMTPAISPPWSEEKPRRAARPRQSTLFRGRRNRVEDATNLRKFGRSCEQPNRNIPTLS
jgi:hypothetical protein